MHVGTSARCRSLVAKRWAVLDERGAAVAGIGRRTPGLDARRGSRGGGLSGRGYGFGGGLGLDRTTESLLVRLAADAVGLLLLDARGVALDADAERLAEVERLLVGQPELARQLVHTDACCH
jgi:hypothetical protein